MAYACINEGVLTRTLHSWNKTCQVAGSCARHNSQLREPGFESSAALLKPWANVFTLHCSSSLSCINEYLAIDSGGQVYEQPSRISCSMWLDVSQRSRDGVKGSKV